MIKFVEISVSYRDSHDRFCVDRFAVSHDSVQAFLDSCLDTFGFDCVVRILGSFEFPSNRFWYKMV